MMKKIGRQMSVLMGVSLSLCLSLLGNLASGHFRPAGFLISFAASTAISLLIGLVVPVKRLGDGACRALSLTERSLGARCVETLVSDLLYTPLITFVMVAIAYKMATAQGAPLRFLPLFLPSLAMSLVAGYVLIFFLMPFFLKRLLAANGVQRED